MKIIIWKFLMSLQKRSNLHLHAFSNIRLSTCWKYCKIDHLILYPHSFWEWELYCHFFFFCAIDYFLHTFFKNLFKCMTLYLVSSFTMMSWKVWTLMKFFDNFFGTSCVDLSPVTDVQDGCCDRYKYHIKMPEISRFLSSNIKIVFFL